MKAVLCQEWGSPGSLVLEEIPSPIPSTGEVLVGVHASGVNYADTVLIAGQYQARPPLPFSPGFEVAGEVLAVGKDVQSVKPGDRVAATCIYGGYAEAVSVPEASVYPIPEGMDYVTAAAFTIAHGTAHVGLTYKAGLKAGEALLVHGAAGGVGLAAVEIGKLLGAMVIATAGSRAKLKLAEQYGADYLINYNQEEFWGRVKKITGGNGADVIFDPVGGDVFDNSVKCISRDGRLLVIGFASGRIPKIPANLVLVKNFSVIGLYWGAYALEGEKIIDASRATLMAWWKQGKLHPYISRTYPLEQAQDALNHLLRRESTGRVVLSTR
jgi:NADPH2:quinone reductase